MTKPTCRIPSEDDTWTIRAFLREAFLLNGLRQRCWDVARWDYWIWHGLKNIEYRPLGDLACVWEIADAQIVGLLVAETQGEAYPLLHPLHRTRALEEEMILKAEERFAKVQPDGSRLLRIWADDDDPLRQEILARRGYTRSDWPEYRRRRSLSEPVPETPIPAGYSVRALGDGAELLERCYVSGLVFHPDEIQYAVQNRSDVTWYRNIQTAPLYRRDLDIVAIAPDGAVAAFCTVWFDDVTRTGVFEPVGTAPAHRQLGLGKAVMAEGLRRLQRMGAILATVSSYSERAGTLYASMGFTAFDLYVPWEKKL